MTGTTTITRTKKDGLLFDSSPVVVLLTALAEVSFSLARFVALLAAPLPLPTGSSVFPSS